MTNIKTQPKTAFGKTLHYVIDPTYKAALMRLTGKKTIDETDIQDLETLGVAVNLKPATQLALAVSQSHDIYLYQDAVYDHSQA